MFSFTLFSLSCCHFGTPAVSLYLRHGLCYESAKPKGDRVNNLYIVIYFYFPLSRYLTTMQLVQFATFFIHATFPLFIECSFPKEYSYIILFHGAMFFIMFLNFYIQAYIKKDKKKYMNGSVKKE